MVCYSLVELFGEKLRALSERCRPRDLYDVVHMHRHPDLVGRAQSVASVLAQKCAHAGIDTPSAETIRASPYRDEIEYEWANMLGHQLPSPLPPFADFWATLDEVFAWLAGVAPAVPQRVERVDLDPAWMAPRAITSWRRGFPFELIRYAGANRLKVDIDYRAESGRRASRRVEPYSLRRTVDGNLLLFVVNDRGQLRGYRVDRIAGARPTEETFRPRFLVEF
ncbi:MAG: nucleotidyl transferase AbiEii/AbiGii toxin family protein [Frankiaceae bacterium]